MKASLSGRSISPRGWGHGGLRRLLLSKDGGGRCLCGAGRGPAAEVTYVPPGLPAQVVGRTALLSRGPENDPLDLWHMVLIMYRLMTH